MKKSSTLLWIFLSTSLLLSCKEISPLTPPNPIVGKWALEAWQVYHLPTWYALKTNDTPISTATDTIYRGPAPQLFDVTSLTFTPDGSFSEFYFKNPGFIELRTPQIDHGSWSLSDSLINLNVSNNFPTKLTYRTATDQLITDVHPKTSVVRLIDGSIYTIDYSIRIYYRRQP